MSAPEAVLVDLGVGNLANLERALAAAGGAPRRTSAPAEIAAARRIVLPGVGAFAAARAALAGERESALAAALAGGARLLGVCVGFQLLFAAGAEYGETAGLGLLAGRVERLPDSVPVPHMGWNRLHVWRPHGLTDGIPDGEFAYFAHSYAAEGFDPGEVVAAVRHGREFPAIAVRRRGPGEVGGTQFHPERSGAAGLRLLANFLLEAAWS